MKTIKSILFISLLSLSLIALLPLFSIMGIEGMVHAQPGGCRLAPQWETFGPSAGTGTIEITAPSASHTTPSKAEGLCDYLYQSRAAADAAYNPQMAAAQAAGRLAASASLPGSLALSNVSFGTSGGLFIPK